MITRPLKAPHESIHVNPGLENLRYPLYCTPKYDGWRCLVVQGVPLTARFKPIPNKFVYDRLRDKKFHGFDGELLCPGGFQATQSALSRHSGEPEFRFLVFDYHIMDKCTYLQRVDELRCREHMFVNDYFTELVYPVQVNNKNELLAFETLCLRRGYEGVIARYGDSLYKSGRSTLNEGALLKLKRFVDGEATIIGFTEMLHNGNEQTTNELGLSERGHSQANLVGLGTLGAFIVKNSLDQIFNVGSGMDVAFRNYVWNHKDQFIDKTLVYKSLHVGVKELPRHPVFKGIRSPDDITDF